MKQPADLLSEQCYRKLRSLILRGELSPGQHVTEIEVCKRFEVSRTPAREAISRLQQDGLLRARDARGVCVTELNSEEVPDLYDVRIRLETLAVRWIASRRTAADLREIERVWRMSERGSAARLGTDAEIYTGFLLHETIARRVRSPFLSETLLKLYDRTIRLMWADASQADDCLLTKSEHERLIAAIRAQDPDGAEQITVVHLERSKQNVLRFLADRGRFYTRIGVARR